MDELGKMPPSAVVDSFTEWRIREARRQRAEAWRKYEAAMGIARWERVGNLVALLLMVALMVAAVCWLKGEADRAVRASEAASDLEVMERGAAWTVAEPPRD